MTTTTMPLSQTSDARPDLLSRLGRDTAYVLVGFPLAVFSFVVLVTGLSAGAGLLVTLVGLPVLVATLWLARLLAAVERSRMSLRGLPVPPASYRPAPPGSNPLRRWVQALRDPQSWLDVVHGLVAFPLAVVTFSVVVSWWASTLGGLTFWFWDRWLPQDPDRHGLAALLDLGVSEAVLYLALGLFFLLTLVPVVRLCAAAQAGLGQVLLGSAHVRSLQERVESLTSTRAAAADAEVHSLRRLERDIHDGPQQRLVRLGMDLSVAERRLDAQDPDAAREILAAARVQTAETLHELRALSRGIAPPVLSDRGLGAALAAVTARSTVRADLDVALTEGQRLPAATESAAYFVTSEALANVAKHSAATRVHVRVWRDGGRLVIEVEDEDDGQGGAQVVAGHGLDGLTDRVAALDGTLAVTSPTGGPTLVRAELPCG